MEEYRMNLCLLKILALWEKCRLLPKERIQEIAAEWMERQKITDKEWESFFPWAIYRVKYFLLKVKVRAHTNHKKDNKVGFSELKNLLRELDQIAPS
jgi:hypothetical protein